MPHLPAMRLLIVSPAHSFPLPPMKNQSLIPFGLLSIVFHGNITVLNSQKGKQQNKNRQSIDDSLRR